MQRSEGKSGRLEQAIVWRRLDAPGHDACGLWATEQGWRLDGTAVFALDDSPCCLRYEVVCDPSWHTRSAIITGWIGRTTVERAIEALPGDRWAFDGSVQTALKGLVDVDLGFTPATNLPQLRRLDLALGQEVEAPVVYLQFPELTLGRLVHRYRRVAAQAYAYDAPRFGYAATLAVSEVGFVTRYPGLWEMEAMR